MTAQEEKEHEFMTEITRLPAKTEVAELVAVIQNEGALILEDVLSEGQVEAVNDELRPYIEATKPGGDDFTGRNTRRTGALVARSPSSRELILNETVLGCAETFLKPWCERIQLHLSQVISIGPGQPAQQIHRDRWAWGTHIESVEPQFNTIWALTDFTTENGATQIAPDSVSWPDNRQAKSEEVRPAEMSEGSVLLYTGSVFHGGGENRSEDVRVGLNLTYTLGWLRQEENQYLSCPPEIAKTLDPKLQELIGYTMGGYALGYYTPPLPPGEGPELAGPEYALGRRREGGGSEFGGEELLSALQDDVKSSSDVGH
ncbi:MAG: phytanoyl-CoA dioxygenase family protein [Myxococcales bacterium]